MQLYCTSNELRLYSPYSVTVTTMRRSKITETPQGFTKMMPLYLAIINYCLVIKHGFYSQGKSGNVKIPECKKVNQDAQKFL